MANKKIYFVSDFHLGADARVSSEERERQIIRWLNTIEQDAEALFLMGDIFEFWFEYRSVVPKGFTRILGKLAELSDSGLRIEMFIGNHDLWMQDYFKDELGIPTHRQPIQLTLLGKKFFLGHGDGLGPEDYGYKRMKKVFTNPICRWLFSWLHPDIGTAIALYWSKKSRKVTATDKHSWLGADKEWLLAYAQRKLKQGTDVDYFVFGHRHLPIHWQIPKSNAQYINTGDWLWHNSYVSFDGKNIEHGFFETEKRLFSNLPIKSGSQSI